MSDESGESSGSRDIGDAVERSSGDPRLLLAMNAVLSAWFAWIVVWGLDFVGSAEFALRSVATLALVVFSLTYVLVLR